MQSARCPFRINGLPAEKLLRQLVFHALGLALLDLSGEKSSSGSIKRVEKREILTRRILRWIEWSAPFFESEIASCEPFIYPLLNDRP